MFMSPSIQSIHRILYAFITSHEMIRESNLLFQKALAIVEKEQVISVLSVVFFI